MYIYIVLVVYLTNLVLVPSDAFPHVVFIILAFDSNNDYQFMAFPSLDLIQFQVVICPMIVVLVGSRTRLFAE